MSSEQIAFTFELADSVLAEFCLEPGEYVLGRAPDCEISIDLDGISAAHARLHIAADHAAIEDLSADEGTFLRGERVGARTILLPGESVTFGHCAGFLKREGAAPPAKKLPPNPEPNPASPRKGRKAKREKALPAAVAPAAAAAETATEKDALAAQVLILETQATIAREEQGAAAAALASERLARQAVESELRHALASANAEKERASILASAAERESAAAKTAALEAQLALARQSQNDAAAALAAERLAWGAAEADLRKSIASVAAEANRAFGSEAEAERQRQELAQRLETQKAAFLEELRDRETAQQRQAEARQAEAQTLHAEIRDLQDSAAALRREAETLRQQLASVQEEGARLLESAKSPSAEADPAGSEHSGLVSHANKVVLGKLMVAAAQAQEIAALKKEMKQREHAMGEALVRRQAAEEHCLQLSRQLARAEEDRPGAPLPVLPAARRTRLRFAARLAAALAILAGLGFALACRSASTRAEQAETIAARVQGAAPQLYHEALQLMGERRHEEALGEIRYALALRQDLAPYHLAHGHICESLLQMEAAVAAYDQVLALDSGNIIALQNRDLCRRILATRRGAHSAESQYALHRLMLEQGRWPEALRMAQRLSVDHQLLHRTWRAFLEASGLGGRLDLNPDGSFNLDLSRHANPNLALLREMPLRRLDLSRCTLVSVAPLSGLLLKDLNLSGTRVHDLSPLAEMPLEALDISNTEVTDLLPLAGLPLRRLMLDHTQVRDLAALQGMPLKTLHAAGTLVWNLAPLASLPFRQLDLAHTRATDLGALEHLPLEELNLEGAPVTDLQPLNGAPLKVLVLSHTLIETLEPLRRSLIKELNLAGCDRLPRVDPLAECAELERLVLPRQCRQIAFLRTLAGLRFLSYEVEGAAASSEETARQFWLARDAEKAAAAPPPKAFGKR